MTTLHQGPAAKAGTLRGRSRVRFLWLCASVVAYILLSPWFGDIDLLPIAGLSLVLIAASYSLSDFLKLRLLLSLLAGVLVVNWVHELVGMPVLDVLAGLTVVALLFVAALRVFRFVVRSSTVTFNVLMAGVAVYLLIGLCWMMCFLLIWGFDPVAFSGATGDGSEGERTREMLYYSFVTLTTVGYGDLTAVSPLARALTILEVLSGVLYLGVLVARLVSMYRGDADSTDH